MDRHTCRLCFRRFHNGRALGGHMRSHVMAASAAAAACSSPPPLSVSPASTSSTELEDKPPPAQQKNDSSSVVQLVQDGGESDTESSSPRFAVSRRRSKRARRQRPAPPAPPPPSAMASDVEHEQPASSVSDTTTEEDVAMSLVMLSRDSWTRSRTRSGCWGEQNNDDGDGGDHEHEHDDGVALARGRRHQCDVCRKVFRSYQALGGHRASIKKGKGGCVPLPAPSSSKNKARRAENAPVVVVHECPFCFRVFESGQALGGHKRAHMPYAAPATPSPRTPAKCGGDSSGSMTMTIDLNVPAPAATTDDDFELSAVYDAEFGSARQ